MSKTLAASLVLALSTLGACGGSGHSGTAVCGNGTREGKEQCDDGNVTSGDGCEADCTLPGSGTDGGVDSGGQPSPNDGGSGAVIMDCGTLPPVSSGTCSMTAGSASILISGDVLTPTQILKGGQVLVDATGMIACVACDCSAQAAGATTLVCPQGVISPGLINSHDHINFENQPSADTGERYEQRNDWRKGEEGHTKISSGGYANGNQIAWQELRYLMGGATSTVGEGSAAGLVRNLTSATKNQSLMQPAVTFDTFPLGDQDGTELQSGCAYPKIQDPAGITGDPAYLPHVSEGINVSAHNEFVCLSSNISGAKDLTTANAAFIHSVALTASDYATMAASGTSMIWSARTNISLYGDTARTNVAARLGVRIGLGTDWTISGSMNMLRELRCVDSVNSTYYNHAFTDHDLWTMATLGSAQVNAVDDAIGSIATGHYADLSIFDASKHEQYRAVIDANPDDVVLVMRGGTLIYGDKTILDGTSGGAACDTIDVCGRSKSICLMAETGQTLATLQAATTTSYPLFFCDTPKNEPSCVPARKAAVAGSTIYTGVPSADDSDGDGIPDSSDDCPITFDPIRPMDGGKQADADGDGVGDACDPCPLNANTTSCMKVTPPAPTPNLVSVTPASAFVRVGSNLSLPSALLITLDSAPDVDVSVDVASSDAALVVPATVTVPAGQNSAQITVMGQSEAMAVTVTASLGGVMKTSTVRVVGAEEVAKVSSISPATIGAAVGKVLTFTVSLDIPAEAAKTIGLGATGGTLSASSIAFVKDQVSGTFTYTQDTTPSVTITATDPANVTATATVNLLQFPVINEVDYDQPGTDTAEYLELYNNTSATMTLDGLEVIRLNGSKMPALEYGTTALTGTLAAGAYLVIGVDSVTVPSGVTKIALLAPASIQNGPNDAIIVVQTSTGAILDAVSYGGACSQLSVMGIPGMPACDEGTPTTAIDSNTVAGSLCRIPNGTDTDNNAADFKFCATSTPGAANVQ